MKITLQSFSLKHLLFSSGGPGVSRAQSFNVRGGGVSGGESTPEPPVRTDSASTMGRPRNRSSPYLNFFQLAFCKEKITALPSGRINDPQLILDLN